MIDEKIIKKLFKLVSKCKKTGDFPVAAIIYKDNKIISYGFNKRNKTKKVTDHAEIIAINKANKKLKEPFLTNICMVSSLEPCDMCKSIIKEARLEKVYYLVESNHIKKPYKRSAFESINLNDLNVEKYTKELSAFFENKR